MNEFVPVGIIGFTVLLLIVIVILCQQQDDQEVSSKYDSGCPPELEEVKVCYIKDGDSVEVLKSGKKVEIRLYGIDCPEHCQDWGETAKAGLIKLIGGKNVFLEKCCKGKKCGKDYYGRTLATIYVKGENDECINVNEKMVMKGHAWVMRRFYNCLSKERKNRLNKLEYWAKKNKVGLWRGDKPIPPWEWRRQTTCSCSRS